MALIEGSGSQHILRGTASSLSVQFYADGVVADPGSVTVVITRADGTVLVPAGVVSGSGTAPRTLPLTAAETAALDVWSVTWTGGIGTVTTEVHIVGAFLFTIADARQYGDRALADTAAYPASKLEQKRADVTDQFTSILGYSPIPRFSLVDVNGNGGVSTLLPVLYPTALRSVATRVAGATAWTAFTSDELGDTHLELSGELWRESRGGFANGRQTVRVGFEHGRWTQAPGDLRNAALMALRFELVETGISDRAISMSNQAGTTQLWTPGMAGHVHHLPYVDEVLQRYSERMPGIA